MTDERHLKYYLKTNAKRHNSMNLLTFCNNSKYFFDYTNTLVIILLTTALATHGGGHDNWFLRHKCTSHNIV